MILSNPLPYSLLCLSAPSNLTAANRRRRHSTCTTLKAMVHEMAVAAADFDLGEDPSSNPSMGASYSDRLALHLFWWLEANPRPQESFLGFPGPDPAPPVLAGADRSPSVSDLIFLSSLKRPIVHQTKASTVHRGAKSVTPIKRAREPRLSTAGSSPQQAISIPSDSPPPPKKRKTDDSKEGKKREKGKGRAGAGPSGEVPETPVKTVGVTPHEGMRKRAIWYHPPPDILLPYPNNFKKRLVDQDGNELPNGHWAYGAERNLTDENPATIREDGATKITASLVLPCAGRGIGLHGRRPLGRYSLRQCAATKAACCGYQFTAPRPARDGSLSLIDELAPRRSWGPLESSTLCNEDAEERALAYAKDLSNRFRRNVNSSWHNHLRQLVGDAVDLDALTEIIAFAEADPLTQVEFHPRTQNALLTRVTDESITIDARARVGTASPSQDVLEHDLPPAPPAPHGATGEAREAGRPRVRARRRRRYESRVVERIYVGGDLSSDDEEKEEEEEEAAPASADEEGRYRGRE
ncbi:hypothetical protein DFP72DRAFT_862399 [Ephemerocybe angulata]|uniref:Uncharacterized protein n=1 Tax=Ephemerocybe angulata TaxID=980116 RepID=A0A8H6H8C0_9AGAR|nr:hypothetical protein DFP72DRAFT_862399 [Tulosesus angulatus]